MPIEEPEPRPVPEASDGPAHAPLQVVLARGPRRLALLALAAGTLSALVAWLAWEAVAGYFSPRGEVITILGSEQTIVTVDGRAQAGIQGGAAGAGILGAAIGLGLGLAGGFARRSPRAGVAAGLAGAVLGALGGVAGSWVLLPLFYRYEDPISGDLILPLLTQGGVWTIVGAAGGLALGLGSGNRGLALRTGLGGLLGAALGAILYEAVGAFGFPNDETDLPVSKTWVTRLLVRVLVAVLTAAGATLAAQAGHAPARLGEDRGS